MPQPSGPWRVLRYAMTGGVAALVDLGGFALLFALDLPLVVAGAGSFGVAALVNFSLSSRFVFGVAPSLPRLPGFLAGAVLGLGVNTGVMLAAAALGAPPLAAKALGIAVAFGVNYTVNARLFLR